MEALYETVAATAVAPGPSSVNVVPDTPVTSSLKVAVTLVPMAMSVASTAGLRPVTVGAVVSTGGAPPGLSAINCPMLMPEFAPSAIRGPVAPPLASSSSAAPSVILYLFVDGTASSNRRVIEAGAVSDVSTAVPKKPTSIRFEPVVVIDGAVIEVDEVFAWPPWVSIGSAASTPL